MSEFHALRWTTSSSELFLPLAETATKVVIWIGTNRHSMLSIRLTKGCYLNCHKAYYYLKQKNVSMTIISALRWWLIAVIRSLGCCNHENCIVVTVLQWQTYSN